MFKKAFPIIVLLFPAIQTSAQTAWQVLGPQYLNDDFGSSSFITDKEGWVTVSGAMLWHTIDGSVTWDTIHQGISFSSIQFIDQDKGYAITGNQAYKTTDAGNSWNSLPVPASTYYSLYLMNQDTAFIGGEEEIFKTDDGGMTWVSISFPYGNVVDFHFINELTGFAVIDYSQIYKTTDGGATWFLNYENFNDRYYTEIYFIDQVTGFACGYDDNFGIMETPIIERTTNGGNSWGLEYEGDDGRIRDILFRNSDEGYALGIDGLLVKTSSGGASWSEGSLDQDYTEMYSLSGVNDLFAFGESSVFKLPAGSNNWQKLFNKFFDNPKQVRFSNADTGYVVSQYEGLFKTTDGGNSWSLLPNSDPDLDEFDIVGSEFIMASANDQSQNKIYKSEDGGQTWINTYTSCWLCIDAYALDMVNADTGYIASSDGSVYKTVDGGFTWQGQPLSTSTVQDVYFIDSSEGWAIIGEYSEHRIWHTINGGSTWDLQYDTSGSTYFTDVYFFDKLHGWVTFENNCCYDYLVTSDGGTTWNFIDHPQLEECFRFLFQDLLHGWVISDDQIFETNDGGVSWDTSLNIGTSAFTDLAIAENEFIYAVGYSDGLFARGSLCGLAVDFLALQNSLTVEFSDQSTPATSWLWDFGDGSTSTDQNPVHTYADEGTYNVCLTITNSCGSNNTCQLITICDPLNTDFLYQVNGLSYQFQNQITEATLFFWDFGDGTTTAQQNPSHTFPSSGIYTVCLIESDACTSDTVCKDVIVCGTVSTVFSYTATDLMVQFSDESANALSWDWDFGDGNTSTDQNPSHIYSSQGNYNVCLISGDDCDQDTLCQTIAIVATSFELLTIHHSTLTVYPNPFSEATTISFSLEKNCFVAIDLFDLAGRKIETITEGNFEAGNHELLFDRQNLNAGIYLIKFNNGLDARTVKLLAQ